MAGKYQCIWVAVEPKMCVLKNLVFSTLYRAGDRVQNYLIPSSIDGMPVGEGCPTAIDN